MFSPGVWSWLPLPGLTSPVWSPGRFWLLGAGSRPAPSLSGVGVVRVTVPPPCFLAYCGALWLMALWSRHCPITAGLASMDRPLQVSSFESQLCGFCSWFYRASWLAQGVFPCFTNCPTSSVLRRSSFGISASGFASSLRDGFTLPGRVCLNPRSERSLFLHLPGVWLGSLRWGHPVGSGLSRSRSERSLFVHLP